MKVIISGLAFSLFYGIGACQQVVNDRNRNPAISAEMFNYLHNSDQLPSPSPSSAQDEMHPYDLQY